MPATLQRLGPLYKGSDIEVSWGIEADSQSYKAGDLIDIASGKIQATVAVSTEYDTDDGPAWGIVLMDARGSTGYTAIDVPYIAILPDRLFGFPIGDSGGAAADAQYQDVSIGSKCELYHGTAAEGYYINNAAEGDAKSVCVIVEKEPAIGATDTYEIAWVRFLPSMCGQLVGN